MLGTSGDNASSNWSDVDCSNNLVQVMESCTLAVALDLLLASADAQRLSLKN